MFGGRPQSARQQIHLLLCRLWAIGLGPEGAGRAPLTAVASYPPGRCGKQRKERCGFRKPRPPWSNGVLVFVEYAAESITAVNA